MGTFLALAILAILIEAIVQGCKQALSKWEWVSLALGALLCALAGVDAFTLLGVPLSVPGVAWLGPWIGALLTGLIVGRGASAVFDLWEKITTAKNGEPPSNTVNPA